MGTVNPDLHDVQHIALTFSDGSLGVMHFILDPNIGGDCELIRLPGMQDDGTRLATDEAIAHEIAKSSFGGLTVTSWRRIAPADIPADRTYRNAWKDLGTTIDHDMTKAKAIHRDLLRVARVAKLETLDAQYLEADERGDPTAKKTIAAQKQKLRDVTADPRIDAATTASELKGLTLDVLTT